MITGFAHVCILSTDLVASEKFYCGALGLKKKFSFVKDNATVGFYIEFGDGTFIEIFKSENALVTPDNSVMKHICLLVDDIQATIQELRAHGIEISDKKMGCDNSWQAWCTDPSGMAIELHEYTPQSSQFTGANCII